ncbi:hypothetical protein RhiirC2_721979 [Rhizophagus irregularis]|uniref:RRM domain-containing protein n=1 Tax=Rhizophagus irregularis TaxID=588596 RepID=A0A2N1M3W0_9GLOM|nr:hypothetical protein RhiirC2_721979 [Rhizophagus irregularis]
MEKAIVAPITFLHNLQFHEHDPSAKKVDEQLRTLVVTDIPLFVIDAQLRALSPIMAVLCTGHCLRVCPASHSPDQRAVRHIYVALLARLPCGSVAADLLKIAEEVSAKSVNIPFSYNSYNSKPYAYVHFSSAATKESAMGIICALKSIGLTWHEPTEVSSLCHRCGHLVVIRINVLRHVLLNVLPVHSLAMINCINYITNTYLPLILLNVIIVLHVLPIPNTDLTLMLLKEGLLSDPNLVLVLRICALNITIIAILSILLDPNWIMM